MYILDFTFYPTGLRALQPNVSKLGEECLGAE